MPPARAGVARFYIVDEHVPHRCKNRENHRVRGVNAQFLRSASESRIGISARHSRGRLRRIIRGDSRQMPLIEYRR